MREPRELVEMGGEERPGAHALEDREADGPGDGEPVACPGAPPDLVHDDEAAVAGAAQDVRGLVHLHQEGRLSAREVVGRADPAVDGVDEADVGLRRGNVGAHLRHERDEGGLAEERRLAGHVRSGQNHEVGSAVGELDAVRYEGASREVRLHHRVTPIADAQEPVVAQPRPGVPVHRRREGERLADVQLAQRLADRQQRGGPPADQLAHLEEQGALDLHDALGRVVDRALEVGEARGRVALAAHERLPSDEVGGHQGEVRLRDLEVVSDDPVVPQLQVGDAGGRPLLLQVGLEHAPRVALQRVQAVELRVVAALDQPPLGQHARGLLVDGPLDQIHHRPHRFGVCAEHGARIPARLPARIDRTAARAGADAAAIQQCGGLQGRLERRPDAEQVARPRALHGRAGRQPLEVAHAAERLAQPGERHLVAVERLHRVETALDGGAVQEGREQPPPQLARAGRGARLVQHLEQREAPAAVLEVGEQLEVALRRLVEPDERPFAVDRERGQVIELPTGVFADVLEQDPRGDDLHRVVGQTVPLQVGDPELPLQARAAGGEVEAPVGQPVQEHALALAEQPTHRCSVRLVLCLTARLARSFGAPFGPALGVRQEALRHAHLARIQPVELLRQPLGDRLGGERRDGHFPGGQVRVRQRDPLSPPGDRGEVVVGGAVEQALVEHGARGDDFHELTVHQAMAGRRGLLAHGHLAAGGEQARDVARDRVVGDPAHGPAVALGEGEVEQRRALAGVPVEHLVEVSETEEQHRVTGPLPRGAILLHHGGRVAHGRGEYTSGGGAANRRRTAARRRDYRATAPPRCRSQSLSTRAAAT